MENIINTIDDRKADQADESTKLSFARRSRAKEKIRSLDWRYNMQIWHMGESIFTLFRHIFLISVSFIVLYPIISMVSTAFRPVAENYDPSVIWLPRQPTMQNFQEAIQVMNLKKAVPNTLIYALINTILQTTIGMVVAYGFARFRFRMNRLFFGLVLLTVIVPPQTISTSLFAIFNSMGLIGSFWTGWLPSILGLGFRSGLYIFIFRQYFQGMPRELEEAAAIDGCGPYTTFLRIMAPNSKNITITVFLFSMVWNVNDFFTPGTYMANKEIISTSLANFQSNLARLANIGYSVSDPRVITTRVQAACLIVVVPLILTYIFLQKYFTNSIENSGLTGM